MNDELKNPPSSPFVKGGDLANKYREHLAVLRYAAGTIKRYLYFLNRFLAYLEGQGVTDIAAVTRDNIRDYQTQLYETINARGEPNSVFHQNNNLKVIKSFFRFLSEEGYIISDPSRDVSYARTPKRLPRSILSQGEAKKIIHSPNTRTVLGYRDRTILEVLYTSGIRRKELINLTLQDVNYHEGMIRINSGKGDKDRVVPIGKIACRYLENYVKAVRPSLIKDPYNNHLFLTMKGTGLSENRVWDMVKIYSKKAKIKKNISPHTFRHTCATLMLKNKANVRHIQELLGHASLDSTQVYSHVSITDLKEVHSRCHPREKDKD
jgi:integrase/recombinase XerD